MRNLLTVCCLSKMTNWKTSKTTIYTMLRPECPLTSMQISIWIRMVPMVALKMLNPKAAMLQMQCSTTICTWAAGQTTLKSCFHWSQASKMWTTSVSQCQSTCCNISHRIRTSSSRTINKIRMTNTKCSWHCRNPCKPRKCNNFKTMRTNSKRRIKFESNC